MPISSLFVILMFCGIPIVGFGAWLGYPIHLFLLYNISLIVLLIVDYRITPGKSDFVVGRYSEEKLSMGTQNDIRIKIRNNSTIDLKIDVKDSYPEFIKVDTEVLNTEIRGHSEEEVSYLATPLKRGEYEFKDVFLRYKGRLNLCVKVNKYDVQQRHKVYPNLRDITRYGILMNRKAFLMEGVRRFRNNSSRAEFESIREYVTGDDFKRFNFKASARAHRWMVNTYEDEKNQNVMILINSSRMMSHEINGIKKMDYAINSAVFLADVVLRKGDKAGLMVFDNEVKKFLKPGRGSGYLQLIAESLYNVEENIVAVDYKNAFSTLNQHQGRRSLVCIITEVFNIDEAIEMVNMIKTSFKKHLPFIVTIKDPRIYDIANQPIKSERELFLHGSALQLVNEREKVIEIFKNARIPCLDIEPDKLSVGMVNRYLDMKARLEL